MRLRSGAGLGPDAASAEALPHEVLVRIFSLLPRGALKVTPGRVNRAWAAAKAEAWTALKPAKQFERWYPYCPAWYVRQNYSAAPQEAKSKMRESAIRHGQIELLEELYAADRDSFGSCDCSTAAQCGQLSILQWLRARGSWWCETTCEMAAEYGHFELLKKCVEMGCPIDASACTGAACGGHIEILAWCRAQGLDWGLTCFEAPCNGHFELLKWAVEVGGMPLDDEWTCYSAVRGGHVEILAYCVDKGCPYDPPIACMLAASNGQRNVLEWCLARGAQMDAHTSAAAAGAGDVDILQWCVQRGAPVDETAAEKAAEKGHRHVLAWLVNNGFPVNVEACLAAAKPDDDDTRSYLQSLLPAAGVAAGH
jgi:hypothetical protein